MTLLYQVVTKFHTKFKLQGISLHKNQIVLFKKALSSKKNASLGHLINTNFIKFFHILASNYSQEIINVELIIYK